MFKPYNQNQAQLLPPHLSDMISKDHIARLISHAVDTMDLSFIENTYSPDGQHAYPPRMLLKILIYGYSLGIRGSRKLEDKLKEDIVFMWLAGRLTPDFRTISDFRKDKLQNFKEIFTQILDTCFGVGIIRVGKVSLDGTKILANASRNRAVYRKQLAKRKEIIRQKVDEIMKEVEAIDAEEEAIYGNTTSHRTGKEISNEAIEREVKRIEKERAKLKKEESILKVKEADIKKKERIMRKDRNSFSPIDKDATVMYMKEGYVAPGYNAQIATEHQVVLGYGVYTNRTDHNLLKPMIEEVEEHTGRIPKTLLADAGYGNKKNYRYLRKHKIQSFMPYNNYEAEKILRNKGLYTPPKNPDKELERYKILTRMRLKSEEGKRMMKRRREDVEPVFGNLKRNMNFRRFNLRGKRKCELELGIFSVAHNLLKIKNWVKKMSEWDDGRKKVQEVGVVLGYLPA